MTHTYLLLKLVAKDATLKNKIKKSYVIFRPHGRTISCTTGYLPSMG